MKEEMTMGGKKKVRVPILRMEQLTDGIYDMVIEEKEIAAAARAGQFLSLYLEDASRLLPRPISICEIDKEAGTIRMVFRIQGEGTRQISNCVAGDKIEVMGPLGNGFFDAEDKVSIVVGGGIGIPPLLGLAKKLHAEGKKVIAVLGYRDAKTFLAEEFQSVAEVVLATEDGSAGVKGNVVDAIRKNHLTADMVYSCGPAPMLRGIKVWAQEEGVPAQISMEEKMACGIGACLACVCKSTEKDGHSNVNNKRVCKDGPVFWMQEVEI